MISFLHRSIPLVYEREVFLYSFSGFHTTIRSYKDERSNENRMKSKRPFVGKFVLGGHMFGRKKKVKIKGYLMFPIKTGYQAVATQMIMINCSVSYIYVILVF